MTMHARRCWAAETLQRATRSHFARQTVRALSQRTDTAKLSAQGDDKARTDDVRGRAGVGEKRREGGMALESCRERGEREEARGLESIGTWTLVGTSVGEVRGERKGRMSIRQVCATKIQSMARGNFVWVACVA